MLRVLGWRSLKIVAVCMAAFVLYCVGKWAYISIRNYQGYCSGSGARLGINLNTQERLDLAVADYLQNQVHMDFNEIENVESENKRQRGYMAALKKKFTLIPYSSQEEFYLINPGCCERSWLMVEGEQFGFWERAAGAGNGMFIFTHKVRYKTLDGTRKEINTTNTYMAVNNCGYPTYRFYY